MIQKWSGEFPYGYKEAGKYMGMAIAFPRGGNYEKLVAGKHQVTDAINLIGEWYLEHGISQDDAAVIVEHDVQSFSDTILMYDPFAGKWADFNTVKDMHKKLLFWVDVT